VANDENFQAIPEETMSEHHTDLVEENIETHPVKLAVAVLVGAVAMIIGLMLIASYAVGSWGQRSTANDPAMSPGAVAKRIAPVAKLAFDSGAPAPSAAPATATPATAVVPAVAPAVVAAAPAVVAAAGKGESTYKAACAVCHAAGVAGAPKSGDKAAWAPRIKSGPEALYASAIKGKGAMPAKGGNAALADADVKAAVDFMVAAAK
jgi:cytochrome c5